MKKLFVLILTCMLILGMAGCQGKDSPARESVEVMLDALISCDYEKAQSVMHPDAVTRNSNIPEDWEILCAYVNGVGVKKLKWTSYSNIGIEGDNAYQTNGTYDVKLENGEHLNIEYTYVKDDAGVGLVQFRLSERT